MCGDTATSWLRAATPPAEREGEVVIRRADDNDVDAITQVFLASRAAAMPYLPRLYDDEQTRAWIAHVVLPGCATWVAASPDTAEVLGFAALDGDVLEHLYLRPDVRRQGIGTTLLEQVRQASPGGLSLRVFTRNTGARAFYERHGFRAVDENDGSRNEENEPDMTYVWHGRH
jgi:GNAT superfamily N-acetyltransferase